MARVACLFSVEYYDTVEHPLSSWDKVPFGLSIVAACLERAGHEVRCWVVCPNTPLDRIAREIVDGFGCDVAAATSVTTQFPLIARLCQRIKDLKTVPILLGGVHATIRPEECIAHPAIDAICIGEGEDVAVSWVHALAAGAQPCGIPGTWIKIPDRKEIDRTPPAPFRTELDRLPLMNYSHWARWVNPEDRTLRVVVGRGCPYACTYCSNHALRRVQPGRYVRFRSPGNIVSEIELILNRYPDLTTIYLEIETIGSSISWALQLCDALATFNSARKRPLAFRANLAVTSQLIRNEGQLRALLAGFKRANLSTLNVGLESGSERIRKEILNRPPYSNQDLIRFCELAHEYEIEVTLYILMGVPTETVGDAAATSAVARACDPLDIAPSIYYPYPGTKLHALSAQMHLIDPDDLGVTAERSRAYLKLKNFPRWRVFTEYALLEWRIFRGRRNPIRLLRIVFSRTLRIVPWLLITALHWKTILRKPTHRQAARLVD